VPVFQVGTNTSPPGDVSESCVPSSKSVASRDDPTKTETEEAEAVSYSIQSSVRCLWRALASLSPEARQRASIATPASFVWVEKKRSVEPSDVKTFTLRFF